MNSTIRSHFMPAKLDPNFVPGTSGLYVLLDDIIDVMLASGNTEAIETITPILVPVVGEAHAVVDEILAASAPAPRMFNMVISENSDEDCTGQPWAICADFRKDDTETNYDVERRVKDRLTFLGLRDSYDFDSETSAFFGYAWSYDEAETLASIVGDVVDGIIVIAEIRSPSFGNDTKATLLRPLPNHHLTQENNPS